MFSSKLPQFRCLGRSSIGLKTRNFSSQEEVDMAKLAVVFCQRKGDARSLEDVLDLEVPEQKDLIARFCHKQVVALLSSLSNAENSPDGGADMYRQHGALYHRRNSLYSSGENSAVTDEIDRVNDQIQKELGFSVKVGKSSVDHEDAGEGVFMQGTAKIGSVVAIYPGRVYLPHQIKKITNAYYREQGAPVLSEAAAEYEELFGTPDAPNMHKIQRFDGTVINAAKDNSIRHNLFAVGHKINHPPAGVRPNVLVCPYDFPKIDENNTLDFGIEKINVLQKMVTRLGRKLSRGNSLAHLEPRINSALAEYIPNKYWQSPGILDQFELDLHVRSLVMVAIDDINDSEELYVNYRFNPSLPNLPSWYSPVDVGEDNRRWKL